MLGPTPEWEVYEGLTIAEVGGCGKDAGIADLRCDVKTRQRKWLNVYGREKIAEFCTRLTPTYIEQIACITLITKVLRAMTCFAVRMAFALP
jgi:hypothetical protein